MARDIVCLNNAEEFFLAFAEQVVEGANGTLFYTDFDHLYIYDKQLPKIDMYPLYWKPAKGVFIKDSLASTA